MQNFEIPIHVESLTRTFRVADDVNTCFTGADPDRLVTGFLGDLKFLGPRPFPVWATPFFFPKCPSSCGHSLYSLYEV